MLVSGFLTTIAFGRVFLFTFWRPVSQPADGSAAAAVPQPSPGRSAIRWRMAPIVVLTAFTVWFGLFPDSLIVLTQQAAGGLSDPTAYIRSVFPEGGVR